MISTDNEQLLLLTISNLRHDDPLQSLTVDRLTKWLIDSEYPLDQTAVNAVLRGLEYRELVVQRSSGIELTCGLFQTWLLSHTEQNVASSEPYVPRLRRLAILAIALLVLITLLLLIALSNLPQQPGSVPPEPTVTLASGN